MEPSTDVKTEPAAAAAPAPASTPTDQTATLKAALAVFSLSTICLLIATIVLATDRDNSAEATLTMETLVSNVPDNKMYDIENV